MEVKEFVKSILKDVTEAVEESNNEKRTFHLPDEKEDGIDFDLAVTLKKVDEQKIKAEIVVVGGNLQRQTSEEMVNRIKFRVRTWQK